MGERLTGGTAPDGRRPGPVRESGAPDGPVAGGAGTAELEDFLAVALRRTAPGSEGERRAMAAYRAARETGTRRARTRRRDDWRPREARAGRPVRTTFAVLLAGLTLGGVAFAAVGGSEPGPEKAGERPAEPSTTAPRRAGDPSGTGGTPSSAGTGPARRPPAAKDTEAHCRSYAHVRDRGKALESTAWQRLVEAAGGEDRVEAYCARIAGEADPAKQPGDQGKGNGSPKNAGSSGNTGDQGNADGGGNGSGNGNGKKNTAN
ncbi:hypothetical protein [Streptomyces sp. NPDC093094]|uniref:hypothetical protein n=1 Tax=Streptomyces sp. NPDC093094 TaxID=3366026 RepID=UPI003824F74B